ncbi:fibronectin type III domain-containing protein [Paenibacillus sp. P96]|uniref:Fibronectin type III domain-containing protein n=1 Tax=Paenibacillus zeirhizosphaerae TaxID=2987519 RepID=A0ABT9FVL1_9BACL|nr:fibronectin type III domain-containing protein [Paenibacillus sp. P96]MDP4098517.1 fibronectin type III domain-containing protein [Paenibacillus sp. P96]
MRRCKSILLLIILVSGIFNPYFGSSVYGSTDMPEAANQLKNAELLIRDSSDSHSEPDKQAADMEREEAVKSKNNSHNNEINILNKDIIMPDMPNIWVNNVSWDSNEKQLALQDGADAGGSGVLKSQYKIGDGEWKDYRLPVRILDQDAVIYARTVDHAGNSSAVAQAMTAIAKTRPATPSIRLSSSDYTEQPVLVTITGSRAGTEKTQYKLGEFGPWIDYTEPFTITKEGRTTVYARALGVSMVVSNIASADAKIQSAASSGPVMRTAAEWAALESGKEAAVWDRVMSQMKNWALAIEKTFAKQTSVKLMENVVNLRYYKLRIKQPEEQQRAGKHGVILSRRRILTPQKRRGANAIAGFILVLVLLGQTLSLFVPAAKTYAGSDVYVSNNDGNYTSFSGNYGGTGGGNDADGGTYQSNGHYFFAEVRYIDIGYDVNPGRYTINFMASGWRGGMKIYASQTGDKYYSGAWTEISDYYISGSESSTPYLGSWRVLDSSKFPKPFRYLKVEKAEVDGRTTGAVDGINFNMVYQPDTSGPPAPTLTVNPTNWTNGNVAVSLNGANDPDTGPVTVQYRMDGATNIGWTSASTAVISNEGITNVYGRSVNVDGYASAENRGTAYIDRTAPSQPAISTDKTGKVNTDVLVNITGGSDSISGVSRTEYSLGGAQTAGWSAVTGSFRVTAEGQTTVSARTIDNAGNISSTATTVVTIDRTGPGKPTITPSSTLSNQTVTVQIAPAGDVDLNYIEYRLSGAITQTWQRYNGSFALPRVEGETIIVARSIDTAGNYSGENTAKVLLDMTTPTSPMISLNPSGKVTSDVTASITPGTDVLSGVRITEYALAGATVADWRTYSGSFQVTSEGQTTVSARTVDNAGNISSVRTAVIHIDKTGPAKPTIVPSKVLSNVAIPVEIVPAADSDLRGTEYKLDGAVTQSWQTYSGRFSVPAVEGETIITARSFDDVGNLSAVSAASVQIDTTKPTNPVIITDPPGKVASDVSVSVTPGTDAFSGVEKTEYALSGAENADWKEVKSPFTITTEGKTVVRARTIDKAGNASDVTEEIIRIDRTSPGLPEIQPSKMVSNRDIRVTIEPPADQDTSLTEYKLEGSVTQDWQPYTSWFVIPAAIEGKTVITARSTDDVGNVGEETSVTVLVDTTSPSAPIIEVSKASPSPEDVSVHIRPGTDAGSGMHRTEYILSGATQFKWPVDAADDFNVSAEGTTVITARSYDQAGNVSEEAVYELTIDKSKPEVTVTADAEYAQDAIRAKFKFADTLSGIDKRYIQVSDSPDAPQTWTSVDSDTETTITDEGIWYVHARAIDKGGNVTDSEPLRVVVDRTAPSVPVITATEDDYTAGNVDFTVDGSTDSLSPFFYEYQVGNGSFEKGSSGSITEDGTVVISARAIDAAGNVSAITSKTVYIDKQGPVLDIDPDGRGWSDDDIQASVSFSDAGSGVEERFYKITNSPEAPVTWDVAADNRVEVTIQDEGIWYIHAKAVDQVGNEEITVSKPFHLQEEPKAPSLSVQSVKQDEAVLEWSLPSGSAYTNGYKYTLHNQSTGQRFTADYPENIFTVTDLQPGTRYPFEMIVSNHVGDTTSNTAEVLTLPAAPHHMVVSPVQNDSSQILVSADPVQSATAYRLRAVQADTMQEVFNETVTSSVYAPVLNLQSATFYDISISAINESGEGPATHQSIMSLPASPGFTYVRIGEQDVDLQWDSVTSATYYELERDSTTVYDDVYNAFHDIGLNSGTEYSYRLTATNESGSGDEARFDLITLPAKAEDFRSLDAGEDWIRLGWRHVRGAAGYWLSVDGGSPAKLSADQNEITIRDLPAGQSAQFTIQAYNRSGLGVTEATYALTLPLQVDELRFTEIGEKSVKVSWDAVPGATKYQVSMNGETMTVSDTFAVFNGLEGGTAYKASVASGNSSGFGKEVDASVLTLPAAPQELKSVNAKDTSFTLAWTPSKSAISYRIEQEGFGDLGTVTGPAITVGDLLPGIIYHFRVFAVNDNGEGGYSRFTRRMLPSDMQEGSLQVSEITSSTAQVAWKEVNGADFYRVYLDEQPIGETTSLAYDLSGLSSSQTYVVGVEPVNSSGNGKVLTAAFETLPAGDFKLSSEHTTDSVTLFIEDVQPNDTVVVSLAGKEVYRGKANQFTKNELAPGTSYTFTVWTENTGGVKSDPKELTVRTDTKPSVGTGGGGGQTTIIEEPSTPIKAPTELDVGIPVADVNSGATLSSDKAFVDIDTTFSRDKIKYLAANGVIVGATETTFEPNRKVTRAEFTAMMVRALDIPKAFEKALSFKDTDSGAWYIPELQTAITHVVARGFSEDIFAPNAVINREQASKMIGNAMRNLPKDALEKVYKDEEDISKWAKSEVMGLTKELLVQGYPDGTFRPKSDVTRAEAAEMIFNMLQKL